MKRGPEVVLLTVNLTYVEMIFNNYYFLEVLEHTYFVTKYLFNVSNEGFRITYIEVAVATYKIIQKAFS